MSRLFAAIVKRTEKWDRSKSPMEQPGFDRHAAYVAELEAENFIALAGLLMSSEDVLFVFRADSEEQVRARMADDPWQQDGMARLDRLEEVTFRIGQP